METLATLFIILFLLSALGVAIGMVRPRAVVWWGAEPKRRSTVIKVYGLVAVVSFFAVGLTAPEDRSAPIAQPRVAGDDATTIASPPSSVARTEPRRDSKGGILSDTFEIRHELRRTHLTAALLTDLPDQTNLMVSAARTYKEMGSSEDYVLSYFSESSTVGEWRSPRVIDLDNAKWKEELERRRKILAASGLAFEVARVSPDVTLGFTVPINQGPPFEPRNANLSGSAIQEGSFGRVARAEVSLDYPIDVSDIGGVEWASATDLAMGKSYTISKETPLMPERNPTDPLAAIAQMHTLPAGTSFTVLEVNSESGVWYRVRSDQDGKEGWINSVALLGQEIRGT